MTTAAEERARAIRQLHQPTPAIDIGVGGDYPRDMCTCGESFYDDCEIRIVLDDILRDPPGVDEVVSKHQDHECTAPDDLSAPVSPEFAVALRKAFGRCTDAVRVRGGGSATTTDARCDLWDSHKPPHKAKVGEALVYTWGPFGGEAGDKTYEGSQ